ncbi:IclR family transcriptional regulator [Pseudonocardia oroxyli]|uniref:Transcriptional regulator, IclR family n=1 Tax=Pseudonocardia oroxyli TaxID=366584 RepID=A0A1G8D882_PSEOR|nr:IclR family transcriptional regulator [Pseudonocardia oroxyli]SDH53704.1 transcriptional regulator, IclR family [Pseudonocardia oroxyli]
MSNLSEPRGASRGRRQGSTENGDVDATQFSVTVAKALSILEAFSPGGRPLGNAELVERTGLPKPTVSRLTYTLTRCGYLVFDLRHRNYELGPRSLQLGAIATSRISVPRIARPKMEELGELGFNVGLGLCDGNQMLYLDAVEGKALVGLRLYAGSRMPVLTTAMGRAYLCALPEQARRGMIASLKESVDPARWDLVERKLVESFVQFDELGYCASMGEWHSDINGVAAPIRGRETFVLNIGGPAYKMQAEDIIGSLGPAVARAAQEIAAHVDVASDSPSRALLRNARGEGQETA